MEGVIVFGRGRITVTIGAAVAALAAIGGIAIVVLPHGHAKAASRDATAQAQVLRVVSVTPAAGAEGVNGAAPIQLTLAQAVSAGSGTAENALPVISPAIPGSWHQAGTDLTFIPATGFAPRTHVTIRVPHQAWTASFTTGSYSLLRLQQLLAQLGYLPMRWAADDATATASTTATGTKAADVTAAATTKASASTTATTASATTAAASGAGTAAGTAATATAATASDANAELSAAYEPPAGTFTWQQGYPWSLHSFWQPGQMNLVTSGAIMAFQSDHGMQMDGQASGTVWTALLRAAAAQDVNQHGYTYAVARQYQPETLIIWHDGHEVFHSYANTGIPVSPTAVGTFPVYLRYRFQIMQGTNPDGSHYADPVQFVSYFHGGEAVHYFPRYSYGWEQSLGCVELPLGPAAQAWPYLTYGSLVTVTPE
jgi:L,D-transpeptidase-like protein/Big-like domain-containing protein